MKVLLVNSVYGVGSTGKIVKDLYVELKSNGHLPIAVYGRGKVEEENIIKISTPLSVKIHALLSRLTGYNGAFSNKSAKRLIKLIENVKPDIVHLHNIHGYYINFYKLLRHLKKNNIPTILTMHDELMYTGNCAYAYDCLGYLNDCKMCNNIKEYPKSYIDTAAKQLVKKQYCFKDFNNLTIVTPSVWLKDKADNSLLKDIKKHVIYNGIDTINTFFNRDYLKAREKYNIKYDKIAIAVSDDFSDKRKGLDDIIKLAKKDSSIGYIIVGTDKNCNLNNVICIKRTENQEELSELYSMADVLVITSRADNLPTVCLEGIACGTPVVGYDVGGVAETAPCGLGGFAPLGDIEQLYKLMLEFIDKGRDKDFKVKLREYAEHNYSRQAMLASYMALYKELIGEDNTL